jgi:hypothetical protein
MAKIMQKCLPSLVIKEMQIKIKLRSHINPIRIVSIKNTNKNKFWQGCGGKVVLIHCWWECKLVQPVWKTIWRLLKKLNIDLSYDPAIPLLGIYPKERNSIYYKGTSTPIFTAALFTLHNLWK